MKTLHLASVALALAAQLADAQGSACAPHPLFSPYPEARPVACDQLRRATLDLRRALDPAHPTGAYEPVALEGEYWFLAEALPAGARPPRPGSDLLRQNYEIAVREAGGNVLHQSADTGETHFRVARADGDYWGSVACSGDAASGCGVLLHRVVRLAGSASPGVVVLPAPAVAAVQLPLPPGTSDAHDATEDGDPRGLPRMADYVIGGLSRHTLGDQLPDAQGRPTNTVLGRVETREYRLERYARRGAATTEDVLRHYRRTLELLGATFTRQSSDGLQAHFLRGGQPVLVTLRVRDGGKRYDLSTAGPGALAGASAAVPLQPASPPPPDPAMVRPPSASPADARPAASSGFSMPSEPTLWPPRGTRGMAVLLVGPGVHRAKVVRFGGAEAEILARETARVRLRVPVLPEGGVPVTVFDANGSERLKGYFEVLAAPRADAALTTVPPCDGRPEKPRAGVQDLQPPRVRPGQMLKILGRNLAGVTHVNFTVAHQEVDPAMTGLPPDLVGIDFGASGRPRSAPRWLDTLATQQGASHGLRAAVPGECDPGNRTGHAAVRHVADGEMVVCVPPLALSGPLGVWQPDGVSADSCETTSPSLQVQRSLPSR